MTASDTISTAPARPKKSETREFLTFLVKLILIVVAIRSLFVATFSIPSESMMPRLLVGDYLFVQKWSYGYSRYSFPFAPALFEGRILGSVPTRGTVVVFKDPAVSAPRDKRDIIKRVIGLPGDTVKMQGGAVVLNGIALPRVRLEDFVLPVSPNSPCFAPLFTEAASDGSTRCRYQRFRETLPGGKSYHVLDLATTVGDDTRVFTVPAGHLFLMGDNRDKSADGRFPAVEGGGVGMVPLDHLVGRAWIGVFSTDGSAQWLLPWTWFTAARGGRAGEGF